MAKYKRVGGGKIDFYEKEKGGGGWIWAVVLGIFALIGASGC